MSSTGCRPYTNKADNIADVSYVTLLSITSHFLPGLDYIRVAPRGGADRCFWSSSKDNDRAENNHLNCQDRQVKFIYRQGFEVVRNGAKVRSGVW